MYFDPILKKNLYQINVVKTAINKLNLQSNQFLTNYLYALILNTILFV